ncbi:MULTISPECIES: hypothetical protein [Enterococcus]|uniref:Uncharacterized protein n=1 Tax=Enterococcus gallinarum TaxID=1353 RepID=A0ABD4HSG3_ENTGA|nr:MULTISPECIES: hypothetical protein [Enterococcus]EMF0115781.1 hypothetical protein [Enterococcus hirae]MBA0950147.1 hypothetical protein [Enterococcus gallinarum]MBA0963077.1 hypothetical protein [Enterococcus gallinarum]MBA0974442.1 hypothetical protein [Enterococcus gallinarum]MCR1913556.1 hypothetical protein [Enterococcus hirae]
MAIANTDTFALAVVQSSDPKLTVEEKISLYIEARDKAKEYNKKHPNKGVNLKKI